MKILNFLLMLLIFPSLAQALPISLEVENELYTYPTQLTVGIAYRGYPAGVNAALDEFSFSIPERIATSSKINLTIETRAHELIGNILLILYRDEEESSQEPPGSIASHGGSHEENSLEEDSEKTALAYTNFAPQNPASLKSLQVQIKKEFILDIIATYK